VKHFVIGIRWKWSAGGENMKRLYRSQKNKMIAGVCGGIAEYFDVDPVLIRLLAVLFFFTGGVTLIAYIVGVIIIPCAPPARIGSEGMVQDLNATSSLNIETGNRARAGSLIIGVIMIGFGIHFLLRNTPFFNTYYWWFWDIGWKFFWPSILILAGLFIIFRSTSK
jgi:phage shock protein C